MKKNSKFGIFFCYCCLIACTPSQETEKILKEIECLKQERDSLIRSSDKQPVRFSKGDRMMIPGKSLHPWKASRGVRQELLIIEQVETLE